MFGFPVNLQDSGFQKFTNDADSGFPKIQQREIFYSVKDGFFDDPSTWQTASGRVGLLPGSIDDVYIRNFVTASNSGSKTFTINNLTIGQTATFQTATGSYQTQLYVFGNLKCHGTINATTGTGFGLVLYLYGRDTLINNYVIDGLSSQSTIVYASNSDQYIAPLTYRNLQTGGVSGTKYLSGDVLVTRETLLYGLGTFELGGYNFTSFSTTNVGCNLSKKSSSGTTIFYGLILSNNGSGNSVDISGNADIEIRGSLIHSNGFNGQQRFNSGLGTWKFTTTNGFILDSNANGVLPFYGNIYVDNGLTLTIGNNAGTKVSVYMYGNIIGGNASSRLVNVDNLYFITSQAALNCMVGSLFDFTTWPINIVGYAGNYSVTFDPRFTTYGNLVISGTGTKSLGVNTTLNGNLTSNGVFECGVYNLIVNGTSSLNNGGQTTYPFIKSGSGSLLFVGQVSTGNNSYSMDLSGGNPSVELRGGMQTINQSQTNLKAGTGTWSFTTNNQTLGFLGGTMLYFNGAVRIGAGLTLSVTDVGGGGNNQGKQIVLNSTSGINGLSSTSQLIIGNNCGINIKLSGTTLMTTGIFNPGANSGSMFEINFNGNYTLPYTSFGDLRVNVGSGIKSLSGNTTINNFGFLTLSNGQFQCSTYNLTINGATEIYNNSASVGNYALLKSGSGNVLFVGMLTFANNSDYYIDFSGGNPSVELRGGMQTWNIGTAPLKTGTGTWTFSTNNQAITQILNTGSNTMQFDCPILIDGPITLSQTNSGQFISDRIYNNTINGNNANSKFAMGAVYSGPNTAIYKAATQPMATGILDTSTNLNTWIYGNANQDIKGLPTTSPKQVYRNLTLNGGGTKTLQGYVSVLNTYTLTSPATLANNGFTLTNP
jgi:hypothetical protein